MSTRPVSTFILALMAAIIIAVPINAYFYAYTATILWDWFLAVQYGAGPTLAAWYGISTLFGLLQIKQNNTTTETSSLIVVILSSIFVTLLSCGLTLFAAFCVRKILGW